MIFCRSRQLREKTMNSYEQALRLFEKWCMEAMNIDSVDKISEAVVRRYINDLQERGKYTFYCDEQANESNYASYVRRAGLSENISPHCLRNNFAKRCLMSGMDIYTLSRLLGHSSVTVTEQAYLDLTDEDLGKRYQHFSPLANMR